MFARLGAVVGLLALVATQVGCVATDEEDAEDEFEESEAAVGTLPDTVIYPSSRTQSPITPAIARRLRAVRSGADGLRADVFSKVGDSQTVNSGFMSCLAPARVALGQYDELEATRTFFRGSSAGRDSFARTSISAKVGARASFALEGALASELAANRPAYAVVMYGSNDIQYAPSGGMATYARDILRITDQLLARGVVPILSSAPPRPLRSQDVSAFGPGGADVWAPRFANVVRTVAQARQVPFVDLERELRAIPGFGIGSDKLHLSAAPRGACAFDDAALRYGMNVRNLVTLTALDRARDATSAGEGGADRGVAIAGNGTAANPFRAPELPFGDVRALGESAETGGGGVCGGTLPARFTYRMENDRAQRVHFNLAATMRGTRLYLRSGGSCRSVTGNDAALDVPAADFDVVVAAPASLRGEMILTATPSR